MDYRQIFAVHNSVFSCSEKGEVEVLKVFVNSIYPSLLRMKINIIVLNF